MEKIELLTYPEGKESLASDDIVNVKTSYGSFADTYVCDLEDGDVYCVRAKKGLPPRTHDQLFNYSALKRLSFDWSQDIDGEDEGVEVWGKSTLLVTYPYHIDEVTTLSEAINYLMDMEEL